MLKAKQTELDADKENEQLKSKITKLMDKLIAERGKLKRKSGKITLLAAEYDKRVFSILIQSTP